MHIVEKISSLLGIDPHRRPLLPMDFFPLPFCRYVTIYNEEIIQSNHYEYFNDVVFDIKPFLKEAGIEIVQFLNSPSDKRIAGCSYIQAFNYSQMNFLIKNSLLHICTDAYTNELCGILKIPSICLVGNRYAENNYPYYGDETNKVIGGLAYKKPTFHSHEVPKSINRIPTEKISSEILLSLNLSGAITYETVFTGNAYSRETVCDIIPDFPLVSIPYKKASVDIRFDKAPNEANVLRFCIENPFSITVLKTPSEEFLARTSKNCKEARYYLSESSSPKDIERLISRGIAVKICSPEPPSKDQMFQYIEFGKIFHEKPPEERPDLDGAYFRSSKVIISGGKFYPSYSHLEKGVPVGIINETIESPAFWADGSYYKIMKEKK